MQAPTQQEMFDTAYLAVTRQGAPSYGKTEGVDSCLYSGPDGMMCAFAHIIPQQFRQYIEEGKVAGSLLALFRASSDAELREWAEGVNTSFASDLQHAHDRAAGEAKRCGKDFLAEFHERMQSVATEYGLTVPEISSDSAEN